MQALEPQRAGQGRGQEVPRGLQPTKKTVQSLMPPTGLATVCSVLPLQVMDVLIKALLANVAVWTLVLALLLAALQTRRGWRLERWAEVSLLWICFWVLGIGGVYGFVVHLAFGSFIAEQIGWPNSPFQFEVAYANLTIGILGFTSFFYRRRDYLLAAMVGIAAGFLPTVSATWCRCWWTTTPHHPMPIRFFTPTC